jgi:hypothetical protein
MQCVRHDGVYVVGRVPADVAGDGQNQTADRPLALGASLATHGGPPADLNDVEHFYELLHEALPCKGQRCGEPSKALLSKQEGLGCPGRIGG